MLVLVTYDVIYLDRGRAQTSSQSGKTLCGLWAEGTKFCV